MKKTRYRFMIAALFFFIHSSAFAMVFLAPNADEPEFERYLLEKNQQSYTQWVQQSVQQDDGPAHEKVLTFAQQALAEQSPTAQLRKDWQALRLAVALNREDREVLTMLAEKLKVFEEVCRYILLEPRLEKKLEQPEMARKCLSLAKPLPQGVLGSAESKERVVIDGVYFTQSTLPKGLIQGSYRWRRISNRWQDREVLGTAEEFSAAKPLTIPWVEGPCKEAKLQHPNFSIAAQSQIYFSDDCVVPGVPPVRDFKTWASDHKGLLWGLGIILTGFTAYQLRDKNLVITRP